MSNNILESEVSVYLDYVIVFGQRVERPERVMPSDWLRGWAEVGEG